MDFINYSFSIGKYHDKDVIWVKFDYSVQVKNALRKRFSSAKWSNTYKNWYLPDLPVVREQLGLNLKDIKIKGNERLSVGNQKAMSDYVDILELKAYSKNTIKLYVHEFLSLLLILKDVHVDTLSPERLKKYFLDCLKKKKNKEAAINSKINAIKFYYEHVLNQPKMFFDIPRPKKPQLLPKKLSKKEVLKILDVTDNKKHLLILKLCYVMGLRVSEVVNLKIKDINYDNMRVFIHAEKGKKERCTSLPDSVLVPMQDYCKIYKPKKWLFEGLSGGKYSVRSVQAVFKNAMKKANINKTIGIHGLRHGYATHLIESGTGV